MLFRSRRNRAGDKVSRVMEMLPYQETGMVYLPKAAPWLADFESECAQFRRDGKSTHDDQVDPMCDAVAILLGKNTSILLVIGRPKTRNNVMVPVIAGRHEVSAL